MGKNKQEADPERHEPRLGKGRLLTALFKKYNSVKKSGVGLPDEHRLVIGDVAKTVKHSQVNVREVVPSKDQAVVIEELRRLLKGVGRLTPALDADSTVPATASRPRTDSQPSSHTQVTTTVGRGRPGLQAETIPAASRTRKSRRRASRSSTAGAAVETTIHPTADVRLQTAPVVSTRTCCSPQEDASSIPAEDDCVFSEIDHEIAGDEAADSGGSVDGEPDDRRDAPAAVGSETAQAAALSGAALAHIRNLPHMPGGYVGDDDKWLALPDGHVDGDGRWIPTGATEHTPRVVILYAGCGGDLLAAMAAGYIIEFVCEKDEECVALLSARFPGLKIYLNVSEIREMPRNVNLIIAGSPCQSVARCGPRCGVSVDTKSGMVFDTIRLAKLGGVENVLIENVLGMNDRPNGREPHVRKITRRLKQAGYSWATRNVDLVHMGVPISRPRLLILACLHGDPRRLLAPRGCRGNVCSAASGGVCHECWLRRNIQPDGPRSWAMNMRSGPNRVDTPVEGVLPTILTTPQTMVVQLDKFDELRVGYMPLEAAEHLSTFPLGWFRGLCETTRKRLLGNAIPPCLIGWVLAMLRDPHDPVYTYIGPGDAPIDEKAAPGWATYSGRRGGPIMAVAAPYVAPFAVPFMPLDAALTSVDRPPPSSLIETQTNKWPETLKKRHSEMLQLLRGAGHLAKKGNIETVYTSGMTVGRRVWALHFDQHLDTSWRLGTIASPRESETLLHGLPLTGARVLVRWDDDTDTLRVCRYPEDVRDINDPPAVKAAATVEPESVSDSEAELAAEEKARLPAKRKQRPKKKPTVRNRRSPRLPSPPESGRGPLCAAVTGPRPDVLCTARRLARFGALGASLSVLGVFAQGRKINVRWVRDDTWFAGTVGRFDSRSGRHVIHYNDGTDHREALWTLDVLLIDVRDTVRRVVRNKRKPSGL